MSSEVRCEMTPPSPLCPSEYDECVVLHQWLELRGYKHAHISNESQSGSRSAMIRGAKLKRIGQSKGFPDYLILSPAPHGGGVALLAIEMKRQRGGAVKPEQRQWLRALSEAGVVCGVCKGAEDAINFIEAYLSGSELKTWQKRYQSAIEPKSKRESTDIF